MAKTKNVGSSPQSMKIQGFKGINNVIPAEKCKPNEVQTATNVDINSSGQVMKREGTDKVYSGNIHSISANGINGNATFILFREGTTLKRFNPEVPNSPTTLRDNIIRTNWMQYLALNNLMYYSDTIITGITDGVTSRSWGLEVPPNQLVLAQTTGSLPSGRYLCSLTYVRNDGQESGAPALSYIDLSSNNAGIAISNIPVSTDPTVSYVYIYLSTRNGEVLYLAKTIANGVTSTSYTDDTREFRTQLATLAKNPPPAGHMIQFYNGRIYIIKDNVAWYTESYNYELVDLAHSFLLFPHRITLWAPVKGGIWVSLKNHSTFFLEGTDPEKGFITHNKTEHGAYEGSQKPDNVTIKGEVLKGWYWTGSDGIYLGLDGGNLLNKTEDRYIPESGDANICVSFIKKTRDGSKQYVSVILV